MTISNHIHRRKKKSAPETTKSLPPPASSSTSLYQKNRNNYNTKRVTIKEMHNTLYAIVRNYSSLTTVRLSALDTASSTATRQPAPRSANLAEKHLQWVRDANRYRHAVLQIWGLSGATLRIGRGTIATCCSARGGTPERDRRACSGPHYLNSKKNVITHKPINQIKFRLHH
jgi:hypothetical protein